ncbi:two-component system OmpR family response regulator [Rhizobium sp. SG_E_25_P2]|uniref:response regulator transcription factor n=1 Tax=Rhizobium sp. SG_E_25_P2 TaxID=2879942 RepID=UPI002474FE5A|nr:response regulator transcription factor [Rhizobium sp. SG_E_25_P2]MDH6267025.1 two-component system OmpR family response regulator [Rhizobium sp. SG_E_25_P2]
MRLLLVEDDRKIGADIASALTQAGYTVEICADGEEAWFLGDTEDYDLIILDIGLPKLDGLTIIKRWRQNDRHMPVMMLTARASWAERVEGIDAGADDYLPKPFQFEELIARVRALIRRSVGIGSAVLSIGPLSIDPRSMRVSLNGAPLALTPLEYRLISYLGHHRGRVVPPTELQSHLYGDDFSRDANALEVLITRLRRKLGADLIGNRRGFGYYIGEEP